MHPAHLAQGVLWRLHSSCRNKLRPRPVDFDTSLWTFRTLANCRKVFSGHVQQAVTPVRDPSLLCVYQCVSQSQKRTCPSLDCIGTRLWQDHLHKRGMMSEHTDAGCWVLTRELLHSPPTPHPHRTPTPQPNLASESAVHLALTVSRLLVGVQRRRSFRRSISD